MISQFIVGDNEPTEISIALFQNSDIKKKGITSNTFLGLNTNECAEATASKGAIEAL